MAGDATSVRVVRRKWLDNDHGQATVEYALIILAAATIALLVVAWAASTGKIGQLLDTVIDNVAGKVV